MNQESKLQLWLGLGFVLIVVIGIVVARMLTAQPQDTRSQASVAGGVAKVGISPTTRQLSPGERTTMTVSFNTSGTAVSGIAVRLLYNYTGQTPNLTADNTQPIIVKQSGWQCPVQQITPSGGTVAIDIGCITTNTSGFSSTSMTELFSFALIAGETPTTNPFTIVFDPEATQITKKSDGADTAAIPTSTASISIVAGASTPTPVPTVANTPTPAPTAANTPTPNPTNTPTPTGSSFSNNNNQNGNSCNQTCFSNRDCKSDLACLKGKCMNPICPSDTACGCKDKDVTGDTGDTNLPHAGSVDLTVLLLIVGGLFILGGGGLLGHHWLENNNRPY